MSLKALHVVFVVASTLLALTFGAWALVQNQNGAGATYLVVAVGSFLAAVTLVVYGRWFLKKLRNVSFL